MLTAITGGLAVLLSLIALASPRRGLALSLVVMSMLVWPEYLRVPVGLAEMSVPRILALVLLLKFMLGDPQRAIRFNLVDGLVIAGWVWTVLANLIMGSTFDFTKEMIGRGLDTVLVYFVARYALTSVEDVKGLLAGLTVTALVMGVLGVYEAVFAESPYQFMRAERGETIWGSNDFARYRWGLLRAKASTSVSIYFGVAMMILAGLVWSLRAYSTRNSLQTLALLAAVVGALSSMSSGPWIGCAALLGSLFFAGHPYLIKRTLLLIGLALIFVEIASNRHFFQLIDHLALDPQTAWYRTRLLEIAFAHWREFWLLGVGSNWPHHWAALLDGRSFIDVVNYFLILALYGGVPGLLMYLVAHGCAVQGAVLAWQEDQDPARRKILSGLAATLVALDFCSLSVGLYGPPLLLSYMLLGMLVSVARDWQSGPVRDQEVLPAAPTPALVDEGPIYH